MRAEAVLALLGDEVLAFLSATTHTDYKVHKLKGAVLFKLLVYGLLTQRDASLRVLEGIFNSYGFKISAGLAAETHTRYNSIRDRLATLPSLYFKSLFEHSLATYSKVLPQEQHQRLLRYDSTMVAVSAHLLDFGIRAEEKTNKRQVKFTIGFDGLLPRSAKALIHSCYTSENPSLSLVSRPTIHFATYLLNAEGARYLWLRTFIKQQYSLVLTVGQETNSNYRQHSKCLYC